MSEQTFGGYEDTTTPVATLEKTQTTHAPAKGLSPLERMKEAAAKKVDYISRFAIPGRDGFTVDFDTNFGESDLKRWAEAAKGKRKKGADNKIAWAACLIERSRAIHLDGELLEDEQGDHITLGHPVFIETWAGEDFNQTAVSSVLRFTGEGYAQSLSDALAKIAGFMDDVAPMDPTNG